MTREEEIRRASYIIANGQASSEHFIQGAQWADKTLIEDIGEWWFDHLKGFLGEGLARNVIDNDFKPNFTSNYTTKQDTPPQEERKRIFDIIKQEWRENELKNENTKLIDNIRKCNLSGFDKFIENNSKHELQCDIFQSAYNIASDKTFQRCFQWLKRNIYKYQYNLQKFVNDFYNENNPDNHKL